MLTSTSLGFCFIKPGSRANACALVSPDTPPLMTFQPVILANCVG